MKKVRAAIRGLKRKSAPQPLQLETLEARCVPCGDVLGAGHVPGDDDFDIGTFPAISTVTSSSNGTLVGPSLGTAAAGPAVPAYSSLPGAHATVYLNFAGDSLSSWLGYTNVVTPVFDTNGDPTTFSSGELTAIYQIWQDVAEDYAPFNINVTTIDPRTQAGYTGGVTQIDIGGNGSWTGGTYGGIGQVGGFGNSSASNPVRGFVFPVNLGNGNPRYVGDASSHESGHTLGLQHQSLYSGTTKTAEYQSGPGDGTAPIMGNSYSALRSLWWYGQNSQSSSTYQNDMAVIAANLNVGYRTDDYGNSISSATPLTVSGTQVSGSGLIGQMTDLDYFSFVSDPGAISLTVSVPRPFNNLSARLELRDANGNLLASAGPDSTFGATLNYTLSSAGTYYLVVASSGVSSGSTSSNYGFNVGTYSISGTIVTSTSSVLAPSNLTANSGGSTNQATLNWTDNATNEDGYTVERSSDGGATWSPLATLAANSTSYLDSGLAAGSTCVYRVRAFKGTVTSAYSNQASATTVPLAPTGLTATTVSASQISLTWNDVTGETGFKIERSTDGVNWTQIGTTAVNVTSYQSTGLSGGTTYYYRVRATDAGGDSGYSNQASATTPVAPTTPAAPSNLTATAVASNQVVLAWQDNSTNETGFIIERSSNGGKSWSQVGQIGTDITTFTDTSVSARKTYLYRVRAFNSGGTSAASNVIKVATPRFAGNAFSVFASSLQQLTSSASASGTYSITSTGTWADKAAPTTPAGVPASPQSVQVKASNLRLQPVITQAIWQTGEVLELTI